MSKLRRPIVAVVSALGLFVAMITPASAGTATYNCGGGSLTVQINRMSPWPKVRLDLSSFTNPSPILPGGMVATLYPPPSVVPSFNLTNSAVIPTGFISLLTLTGTPLPGDLHTPDFMKIVSPSLNLTCFLTAPGTGPWPIP